MNYNIDQMVKAIAATPGCRLLSSVGIPAVPSELRLPDDVARFYQLCGGARLYDGADFSFDIVAPSGFVASNLAILNEDRKLDDITDNWHIIAWSGAEQAISIDLAPQRLGRCYDSFWDRHGVAGSCPVVARSFGQLLISLLESEGDALFWLDESFASLGDAYD
jgi:antitoxin YokJ